MDDSLSLGRIAGVRVGLNWSVLLVLAFLVWTLSQNIFPDSNPGLGDTTYLAMGAVASLAFLGSILLHELGHAVEARRDGMEIDGITLWLFGGVARFRGTFPSAGAEFRIAVAGPLVSLVLGAVLLGGSWLAPLPAALDGVAAWLGLINLSLLVFNLLPALPLDGGRMLRSALWARTRDFGRATRWSAAVARVIALALIGLGLALALLQGAFGGLWIAFIGWFLLQAAAAEGRAVPRRGARTPVLCVGDLMDRDPAVVPPGVDLDDFLRAAAWGEGQETYPVVDGDRVVGVVGVAAALDVPVAERRSTRVADRMVPRDRAVTLAARDDLSAAIARLRAGGQGGAPVLDGERLVGLLSPEHVARALRPLGPPAPSRP